MSTCKKQWFRKTSLFIVDRPSDYQHRFLRVRILKCLLRFFRIRMIQCSVDFVFTIGAEIHFNVPHKISSLSHVGNLCAVSYLLLSICRVVGTRITSFGTSQRVVSEL